MNIVSNECLRLLYHKIEEMSSTLYEVFHLMCFFLWFDEAFWTLSKSYNWLLPKISTRFSTKIALFSNFLSRPRSCHIILYNYTAAVCDVSAGVLFFFFLPRFLSADLFVVLLLADFVSVNKKWKIKADLRKNLKSAFISFCILSKNIIAAAVLSFFQNSSTLHQNIMARSWLITYCNIIKIKAAPS